MMLVEETSVPLAALPVAKFKAHLRLGSGFADDGLQDELLESFLRAAMAAIEARTGKILIERQFSWTLTGWRNADRQAMPVAPVSVVSAMVLIDRLGDETVVDTDAYRLVPDNAQPEIVANGTALPSIPPAGAVRIEFDAGFGPDWDDLPADLMQAVKMLGAHYYEYRHEVSLGGGCIPFGVSALIERYRTVRISAGGGS